MWIQSLEALLERLSGNASECGAELCLESLFQELRITGGDRSPGKIALLRDPAALRKSSAVVFVLEDVKQNCAEIVFFLRRVKCHPRFRDERGRFRSFGSNHRQSASDSRYGAAPARGNRPADKEQHVATEQGSCDIFIRKQAQHLNFNRSAVQLFEELAFGLFRIAAQNGQF